MILLWKEEIKAGTGMLLYLKKSEAQASLFCSLLPITRILAYREPPPGPNPRSALRFQMHELNLISLYQICTSNLHWNFLSFLKHYLRS